MSQAQVYGVKCHFQQYFSYIVAVSFICRGNQSTRRKTPTCRNNSHGSLIQLSNKFEMISDTKIKLFVQNSTYTFIIFYSFCCFFLPWNSGVVMVLIVWQLGFRTTYAISDYHHYCYEFEFCSWRGVLDTTLYDKVCL